MGAPGGELCVGVSCGDQHLAKQVLEKEGYAGHRSAMILLPTHQRARKRANVSLNLYEGLAQLLRHLPRHHRGLAGNGFVLQGYVEAVHEDEVRNLFTMLQE